MKTNYLLPHRFRSIGWIVLIPATILGLIIIFSDFDLAPSWLDARVPALLPSAIDATSGVATPLWGMVKTNLLDEIAAIAFIISAIFVGFSKERAEDEYIAKLRLESLLWATYVSCGIQVLSLILFYNFTFLYSMIINMFTLLVVFIVRFNYVIWKSKHAGNEK